MPSRAYTSFLQTIKSRLIWISSTRCQCPLGLIPHFYEEDDQYKVIWNIAVSMPSRAYTSFLLLDMTSTMQTMFNLCQCPLGLIPHFYMLYNNIECFRTMCQCPLGLIPHFYDKEIVIYDNESVECQCPLGLIPHFYLSTLIKKVLRDLLCQCPLGLIPHFYPNSENWVKKSNPCQCPLGLIPHFYQIREDSTDIKLCQCPLGLIPHFYSTPSKT